MMKSPGRKREQLSRRQCREVVMRGGRGRVVRLLGTLAVAVLAAVSVGAPSALAQTGPQQSPFSGAEFRVFSGIGGGDASAVWFRGSAAMDSGWCTLSTNERYRCNIPADNVTFLINQTNCTMLVGSFTGVGAGNNDYQAIPPGGTLTTAQATAADTHPPTVWEHFDYIRFVDCVEPGGDPGPEDRVPDDDGGSRDS